LKQLTKKKKKIIISESSKCSSLGNVYVFENIHRADTYAVLINSIGPG